MGLTALRFIDTREKIFFTLSVQTYALFLDGLFFHCLISTGLGLEVWSNTETSYEFALIENKIKVIMG